LDLWEVGDYKSAEEMYQKVLPVIVFIMQSIEHLICYGKRIYGLRSGIEIYDRAPALVPTKFGLESAAYWSEYLGSFSSISR
jgi:4-hydroxy-tetrahydrodipicolinate synthase